MSIQSSFVNHMNLQEQPALILGDRLRQLRAARGLSLEELSAALGGIVTRQALWKYEKGKAQPSAAVLSRLARVLDVRAAYLWRQPPVDVRFIAYRKGSGLLKRDQERVESRVSLALEQCVGLRQATGQVDFPDLPVQSHAVESVEAAEQAALEVRHRWSLGTDALGSLTGIVEDRGVHVVEIDADDKFDGICAVAEDDEGNVVAAAVATRRGLPGDRQRLDLAHELGHLVLAVAEDVEEEKAAFRFAGALLAPADAVRQEVGAKRSSVSLGELTLLKRRYGMSIQAWVQRLRDLDVITESHYRQWWITLNKLGYRKQEPAPLAAERPEWLQRTALRALAEGLVTREEAEQLTGEKLELVEPLSVVERRALAKLPVDERRRVLAEQAARIAGHYEHDEQWRDLDSGDVVEY